MDIFEKLRLLREKEENAVPSGPPEWLVVGLGNPGTKYENTRHNTGFMALETLTDRLNLRLTKLQFRALTAKGVLSGKTVLFMFPQTFMNLSGESVAEAANFYKIPPERVLVLMDDISLPVGGLRVRSKGSEGGHNGLKSITACLGSSDYPRIKIGVGAKPHPDYDLAEWVLSRYTKEEGELLTPALEDAGKAAELIVAGSTDKAMNLYNKRGAGASAGNGNSNGNKE